MHDLNTVCPTHSPADSQESLCDMQNATPMKDIETVACSRTLAAAQDEPVLTPQLAGETRLPKLSSGPSPPRIPYLREYLQSQMTSEVLG